MRVALRHDGAIWGLWWQNPPFALEWDRPGIPSSTYLCGYPRRADAQAKAGHEGWEIVADA